jgi:hypothetical protein
MDVRLPNGTLIKNVPEGTTKAQLVEKLRSNGYDVSALEEKPSEGAKFRFASPETEQAGISAIGRAAQAAEEYFTKPVAPAPANVQQAGYDPFAQYAERTLGNIQPDVINIGSSVTPESLAATAKAIKENPIGAAANIVGGAYNVVRHPFESFANAPVSTVLGLTTARGLISPLTTGAANVAGMATPMVRNMLNPKAQMYGEAFGAQMPEAINALAAARPGMTSAQAIADINAPAAQAIGERAIQRVPQEARAVQQAQEAQRATAIGQIAGTPEELAAAKAARDAEAALNYNRAFKQVMIETPELTSIMDRPSMEKAFGRAAQIAEERGQAFQIGKTKPAEITESKILDEFGRPVQKVTPAEIAKYPVQSLHYVKMALDDMVRSPKDFGIGAAEVSAIRDTRKEFISQLENNANYSKARMQYAAQSVPINKMQIAQELQKSLTAPLTGETTRGAMFAKAAEEAPKTIKRATGQEFYSKLEDVLSPDEMKVVNDVRDEFRRTQLSKDQAKLAKASGEDLLSSQYKVPNWLNPIWTFANTIVKRSLGKIDEKLAIQIGMEVLEPAQMQKALKAAQEYNNRTQALAKTNRRPVPPPVMSGAVTFQNALNPQQNQNAMAR